MKKKFMLVAIMLCLGTFVLVNKPAKAATTYVKINSTNFPDANVRSDVKKSVDKNKDGKLSKKERNNCTKLSLTGTKKAHIKSLKGIAFFPNLKSVSLEFVENLNGNQLVTLTKLKDLTVTPCGNTVDLSNMALDELFINDEYLIPQNNQKLLNQDQIKLPKSVKSLHSSLYQMTEHNFKGINNLSELYCSGITISKIDVPSNNKIKAFGVYASKVNNLQLSAFPYLEDVSVDAYKCCGLDFSTNLRLKSIKLENLEGYNNSIDLSKNKKLANLSFFCCDMKKLVLPANKATAQRLVCRFIHCECLEQCNFKDAENIYKISTYATGFTTLDFSNVKGITYIDSYIDCQLKNMVLPKNSAKAKGLRIEIEEDSSLCQCNFNDARNIYDLSIIIAGFNKVDISKLTNLKKSEVLEVKRCPELKEICLPKNSSKAKGWYCDFRSNGKLIKCNFNDAKNIRGLYLQGTRFNQINVSKLKKLKFIYCGQNKKLKKVYLPKWKRVTIHKDKKVKVKKI